MTDKQSTFKASVPNFRPVEFDGVRLDEKQEQCIVFNTRRDRNKAYRLLKKEGFDCRKK